MSVDLENFAASVLKWIKETGIPMPSGGISLPHSSIGRLREILNGLFATWLFATSDSTLLDRVNDGGERLIDACGWRSGIERRIGMLFANRDQSCCPNWPLHDDATSQDRIARIVDAVERLATPNELVTIDEFARLSEVSARTLRKKGNGRPDPIIKGTGTIKDLFRYSELRAWFEGFTKKKSRPLPPTLAEARALHQSGVATLIDGEK